MACRCLSAVRWLFPAYAGVIPVVKCLYFGIWPVSYTHLIAEKLGKQMVMEAGNAALKGHRIVVDKDNQGNGTLQRRKKDSLSLIHILLGLLRQKEQGLEEQENG